MIELISLAVAGVLVAAWGYYQFGPEEEQS